MKAVPFFIMCPSVCSVSDSAMLWTVAHQTSLELSRPEYWIGLPFPTPWDFPDPGIEPVSLESPTLAGRFFTICLYLRSLINVHLYTKIIDLDLLPPGMSVIWEILLDTNHVSSVCLTFLTLSEHRICTSKSH